MRNKDLARPTPVDFCLPQFNKKQKSGKYIYIYKCFFQGRLESLSTSLYSENRQPQHKEYADIYTTALQRFRLNIQ